MKTKKEEHKELNHKVKYSEDYDAYICVTCNEWLEKACSQEDCGFCKDRPSVPLSV